MVWAIILLFVFSGISAYFVMKSHLKYWCKILINLCINLACWMWSLFTDISELSLLLLVSFSCLTLLGIIIHFIAPLFLNIIGKCFSKWNRDTYSPKTYEEHLHDGHRMYFCILLFTTLKTFVLIMFVASSLHLIN